MDLFRGLINDIISGKYAMYDGKIGAYKFTTDLQSMLIKDKMCCMVIKPNSTYDAGRPCSISGAYNLKQYLDPSIKPICFRANWTYDTIVNGPAPIRDDRRYRAIAIRDFNNQYMGFVLAEEGTTWFALTQEGTIGSYERGF